MLAEAELTPAFRGDTPVLCIAGRGLLEVAAATVLTELLQARPMRPHRTG